MQTLKELNRKKNTIIVLIGDHGWHLGEHNFWGKQNILHNAINTPMIIKAQGYSPKKIDQIVEYIYIYPTLCEMTGLKLSGHLQGKSMVPLMKNQDENWENTAFIEWKGARTIVTNDYSYSYWFEEKNKGSKTLFDYRNDPQENKNIINDSAYSEIVEKLRLKLDSLYANL